MSIDVRPLVEPDLDAAERIFRLAFGTAHGVPDPSRYMQDRNYIRSRWKADPGGAVAAEWDGEVAGSVFASNWGSVGVLGPLTVDPRRWHSGVAGRLLASILENPRMRDARLPVLSTAAGNVATVQLYQRFGFWPGFLIPILAKTLDSASGVNRTGQGAADSGDTSESLFSTLPEGRTSAALAECVALAGTAYGGLDLTHEILSVEHQRLGESLFVWGSSGLDAFAVCHCGAGTEAGEGACYVKFGAARSPRAFERLLNAIENLARSRRLSRVIAGVNAGRRTAYGRLLQRGFQAVSHAVAMQRTAAAGYDGAEVLVIDDWR